MLKNELIQGHWQLFSWTMLSPLVVITHFLHVWKWAHWRSSAGFAREWAHSWDLVVQENGPIRGHRQFVSLKMLGQICGHRQYSYEWEWAHWSLSAVFLIENAGLFVVIPVIFMQNGLIQGHVWVFLWMGAIKLIGRFFYVKEWAHSWTLAILFLHGNETIQAHWQFLMWENGSLAVFLIWAHLWHQQFSSCMRMGPFNVIGGLNYAKE